MKNKAAVILKTFLLFLFLILFVLASLFLGAEKISPVNYFSQSGFSKFERIILFDIRLPRICLSVLCGILLGGCGAVLQGFFRNPLADSGILGISSGATLAVVLCSFIPFPATMFLKFLSPVSIFAFAGGLISGLLIFIFSFIFKSKSSVTLLLSGTAIGTFLSSICSILILMKQKDLYKVYTWTMGSFNGKSWDDLWIFIIPASVSIILLLSTAKYLDILGNGEKTAQSLGLNLTTTKVLVLISVSLATACAVCMGGIISFVGLIAPHITRNLFGSEHKKLIPASMLFGGILLLLSDTLSRILIAPAEIHVGIITSLIGVPFFLVVLRRKS